MRPEYDDEGFQHNFQAFEVLQPLSKSRTSQKTFQRSSVKGFQHYERVPPFSTFFHIKNYKTPPQLNNKYSLDEQTKRLVSNNEGWSAETETRLHDEFSEGNKKYELIYNKFEQYGKMNYNFFSEYGREEYKTFIDEQLFPKPDPHAYLTSIISQKNLKNIKFSSNFQCGNLQKVFKDTKENSVYYLILSNDTNTLGFNQWFYFQTFNPNYSGVLCKFRIINMSKKMGKDIRELGICTFSQQQYDKNNIGWSRLSSYIKMNESNKIIKANGQFYYTFQFEAFLKQRDIAYFSLTLPYSFTKLYAQVANSAEFMKIGETFCGNPIICYVTGNREAKKSILMAGRQHPAETSSSFVVDGVVSELRKQNVFLKYLKQKYLIIVIPMVNPDGVIHGNTRTNLMGLDVNRKWEPFPDKKFSFEIYHIFHYLLGIPQVSYLIDFHGHSKKLNSFAYFSMNKKLASSIASEIAQLLPWFRIKDCRMTENVQTNTLRWFAKDFMNIQKAITIETSVHGWKDEDGNIFPFTPQDMNKIGSSFIEVISRIEIKKKSSNKCQKLIDFGAQIVNSDSDPEGDYTDETKKAIEQKKRKKSLRKKSYRIRQTESPKKQFQKTCRQRMKTQLFEELQKLEVPLISSSKVKKKKLPSKEVKVITSSKITSKSSVLKPIKKKPDL